MGNESGTATKSSGRPAVETSRPRPTPDRVAESSAGPIRDDELRERGLFGRVFDGVADMFQSALGMDARTTMEDFDFKQLENLNPGTVLRFAFSPEDMAELDLEGEQEALEQVADVLTVSNPSVELMRHLAQSGQFTDLIWSGHGAEDGLMITDADGDAQKLGESEIEDIFRGSTIDEAMLAACNSGEAPADAMRDVGIDTFGYSDVVHDEIAQADVLDYAQSGDLTGVDAANSGGNGGMQQAGWLASTVRRIQAAASPGVEAPAQEEEDGGFFGSIKRMATSASDAVLSMVSGDEADQAPETSSARLTAPKPEEPKSTTTKPVEAPAPRTTGPR